MVIILKVWTVCVTKVFYTIGSDKMVTNSRGDQGQQFLICKTLGWIPTKRERREGRGKIASFLFHSSPTHGLSQSLQSFWTPVSSSAKGGTRATHREGGDRTVKGPLPYFM